MTKKYVLLVASWPEIPAGPAGDGHRAEWNAMLDRVREAAKTCPGSEQLREGVWQIALGDGWLQPLVNMCSAVMDQSSWGYRILLSDDEPKWLVTSPSR